MLSKRGWTGEDATALRKSLRMTESRFANTLQVSDSTVAHWASHPQTVPRAAVQELMDKLVEQAPPDVKAMFAAQEDSTALPPATLLGQVPQSFPAEALNGPWVTSYQFLHGDTPKYHADIAHITAESDQQLWAVNHPPEPRTEGRANPFRNEIEARLFNRHLIGTWKNTSDTRYFGAVHLAVLPGETVMEGYYTGFASDIGVSTGRWRWVRLDAGSGDALENVVLREPSAIYDAVMRHSQYAAPLTLADIGEEPHGGYQG
jgi:hypothetical protein